MPKTCCVSAPLLVAVCLTVVLVPLIPTAALGYGGDAHKYAVHQACMLFMGDLSDPRNIHRDRVVALYPQLTSQGWWFKGGEVGADEGEWQPNWVWIYWNSRLADYYETVYDGYTSGDSGTTTYTHFWETADGLRDKVEGCYKNAWEKTELLWMRAIDHWRSDPALDGTTYADLGYVVHLVGDMGVPAHTNSDMHGPGNRDSLEQALTDFWAADNLTWVPPLGVQGVSDILYPPHDNQAILNDIYASGWSADELADPDPDSGDPYLATVDPVYNMQQLFRIMYTVNETANYFASDGEDGNVDEPIGWLNGYAGFPGCLHTGDGPAYDEISPQAEDALTNNESGCENGKPHPLCTDDTCDCDGDLTTIAMRGYKATFRAMPAVIDLFRRTIDDVPPITTLEVTPGPEEESQAGWYNTPVTVELTNAEDHGRPKAEGGELRASGVWQIWGLCDDNPPANYAAPSWVISEDGKHKVECMSTDMCGNVEQDNDLAVWVDRTPPEVTFPDLRPNYLTSESFVATWNATDATSGVASETAYLDGQLVTKGQAFNLALLAGLHALRVIAYDNADNCRDVEYNFEVFIDASGWAKPVNLSDKASGNGLFCSVEFPGPYDVGLINMGTCRLAVLATLDLTKSNPVVGTTALLPADRITGVGDSDGDHLRDRMLRFNMAQFAAALGGMTGAVPSVVRGGLSPSGLPHFLAVVSVPVFTAPKK
jgi:hypothetical protein